MRFDHRRTLLTLGSGKVLAKRTGTRKLLPPTSFVVFVHYVDIHQVNDLQSIARGAGNTLESFGETLYTLQRTHDTSTSKLRETLSSYKLVRGVPTEEEHGREKRQMACERDRENEEIKKEIKQE